MSRIPDVERLQIAKEARDAKSLSDKIALAQKTLPKPLAAMVALNLEATDVIARLAQLVERGSSSILIDKAATAMQGWNHAVLEAEAVVRDELRLGPR
jgi:hypothetical protein